jgi:hypothetical protein
MLRISRLIYACLFLTATCYAQIGMPGVKSPRGINENQASFAF